ncbi:MAG: hypothetical protein IJN17_07095, partial [Clostridia bacterium]|nr:hypothetical protein [Clostridia bacterium]
RLVRGCTKADKMIICAELFDSFLSLRHFALRQNATVSLRRRAGSALTVHRTVIHSLAAASLPKGEA